MLQFQARDYVIALDSDWSTHVLTHAPTPYWCKLTITRSIEGAKHDAIPKCPKCTGNTPSALFNHNCKIRTPSRPCDNITALIFTNQCKLHRHIERTLNKSKKWRLTYWSPVPCKSFPNEVRIRIVAYDEHCKVSIV